MCNMWEVRLQITCKVDLSVLQQGSFDAFLLPSHNDCLTPDEMPTEETWKRLHTNSEQIGNQIGPWLNRKWPGTSSFQLMLFQFLANLRV